MQKNFSIQTTQRSTLVDITKQVKTIVNDHQVQAGIVNVYVQGATAGIMIQENWDDSVQQDVVDLLEQLIPKGVWRHDQQDGNGDAHLKSGLVSPSESIPIINGTLGLSTWQNIFLCEFDGPRTNREIIVTIIEA